MHIIIYRWRGETGPVVISVAPGRLVCSEVGSEEPWWRLGGPWWTPGGTLVGLVGWSVARVPLGSYKVSVEFSGPWWYAYRDLTPKVMGYPRGFTGGSRDLADLPETIRPAQDPLGPREPPQTRDPERCQFCTNRPTEASGLAEEERGSFVWSL